MGMLGFDHLDGFALREIGLFRRQGLIGNGIGRVPFRRFALRS